jgi:hypothetical protein
VLAAFHAVAAHAVVAIDAGVHIVGAVVFILATRFSAYWTLGSCALGWFFLVYPFRNCFEARTSSRSLATGTTGTGSTAPLLFLFVSSLTLGRNCLATLLWRSPRVLLVLHWVFWTTLPSVAFFSVDVPLSPKNANRTANLNLVYGVCDGSGARGNCFNITFVVCFYVCWALAMVRTVVASDSMHARKRHVHSGCSSTLMV